MGGIQPLTKSSREAEQLLGQFGTVELVVFLRTF